MSDFQEIRFDQVSDLFLRNGCLHTPSELHGELVGQLCAGKQPDTDQWLRQCLQFMQIAQLSDDQDKVLLAELLEFTIQGIQDVDLGFDLLIAGEDFSLNERMQSLLEWCEGFLSVLPDNTALREGRLSNELTEALQDIEQVADLKEPLADDEQNEQDFFAVSDYVRMTAMLLYTECQPSSSEATVESLQ